MTQSTTQGTASSPSASALPTPKERRRLREAKSMTVKQLAATLGVTQATVRGWETGRTDPGGRKGEHYARLLAGFATETRAAGTAGPPESDAEAKDQVTRAATDTDGATEGPADAHAGTAGTAPRRRTRKRRRRGGSAERTEPGHLTESPAPEQHQVSPPTPSRATGTTPAPAPAPAPTLQPTPGQQPAPAPTLTTEPGSRSEPKPGTPPASDEEVEAASAVKAGALEAEEASGAAAAEAEAPPPLSPEQAFDTLYGHAAPGLVRQAYLLCGQYPLAQESVERAFQLAWQRWPEVAVDRDPVGWVRAAVYEYATSPWHRFRRNRGRNEPALAAPAPATAPHAPAEVPEGAPPAAAYEGTALREALLHLPPVYRRTVLLYDGLGLDLPETAAETEASTPATGNRVLHAREALAERLPELDDAERLHQHLDALARTVPVPSAPTAQAVRKGGERRAKFWTRAAIVLTVLIVGATVFTVITAPRKYDPPEAPPERVGGVPVPGGPQRLTKEDVKLRDALRAEPVTGPQRLLPQTR